MATALSPAPAAPAQAPAAASPSAGGGMPNDAPTQHAPQAPQRDRARNQEMQPQAKEKGLFGTLVDAVKDFFTAAVSDTVGIGNGNEPQYHQPRGSGRSQGAHQPAAPAQSRENSQGQGAPSSPPVGRSSPGVMQTFTTQDKDGNFQVFDAKSGDRVAPGLEKQVIASVKEDIASGKLPSEFGKAPDQPAKGQAETRAPGTLDNLSPEARKAAVDAAMGGAGGVKPQSPSTAAPNPQQAPTTPAPAAAAGPKVQSAGASR